jgi:hypothetical protein
MNLKLERNKVGQTLCTAVACLLGFVVPVGQASAGLPSGTVRQLGGMGCKQTSDAALIACGQAAIRRNCTAWLSQMAGYAGCTKAPVPTAMAQASTCMANSMSPSIATALMSYFLALATVSTVKASCPAGSSAKAPAKDEPSTSAKTAQSQPPKPSKYKSDLAPQYKNAVLALGCADAPDQTLIPCGVQKVRAQCQAAAQKATAWKTCQMTDEIHAAQKAIENCVNISKGQELAKMLDALSKTTAQAAALFGKCQDEFVKDIDTMNKKILKTVKEAKEKAEAKNENLTEPEAHAKLKQEYQAYLAEQKKVINELDVQASAIGKKWDDVTNCAGITPPTYRAYESCNGSAEMFRGKLISMPATASAYQKAKVWTLQHRLQLDQCIATYKAIIARRQSDLDAAIEKGKTLMGKLKKAGCKVLEAVADAGYALDRAMGHLREKVMTYFKEKVKPFLETELCANGGLGNFAKNQIESRVKGLIQKGIDKALNAVLSGFKSAIVGRACDALSKWCASMAAAGGPLALVAGLSICKLGCTAAGNKLLNEGQKMLSGAIAGVIYNALGKSWIDKGVDAIAGLICRAAGAGGY